MTTPLLPDDTQFEAFLDGTASDKARAAIASAMENDEAMRDQAALQASVDAALRRVFSPPSPQRVLEAIGQRQPEAKVASHHERNRLVQRRWAVAAILALGIVGVYRTVNFLFPERDEYPRREWQTLDGWYATVVANDLRPDWVCRDDQEFQTAIRRRLGQALTLAPRPDEVSVGGLAYANAISERTMMVLGRVRGEPAVVFVDRADRDRGPSVSEGSGLKVYRHRLGDLVLYEVSHLDHPVLLDFIELP